MRLRSHTTKTKGHKGRCEDVSPCPAKRPRSDPGKNTKIAGDASKRSPINFESEIRSTVAVVHESPGPSQNKNGKIEPFDSKSASLLEQLEDHFVPLNSLPAAQAAFSIAKVREKILSFMNPRDLLRLRLVSRNWRRDATNKALLNWKKNVISLSKRTVSTRFLPRNKHKYQQFLQPAQELTELMNKTGSYPFPCSQFRITLTNWKDEEIQSFLTTHGCRIHKLTLYLDCEEQCEEMAYAERITICSHQQNWLLQMLAKLLFHQAPNLEKIDISFYEPSPRKKACKPIVDNFIFDQSPQVLHTKLRSVEISRNITVSVFDFICRLAPNLTEFKCLNLNYYLDPILRLYLLKDLAYFPDINEPEENLPIKRIANTDGKLSLQELCIQFPLWSSPLPEDWPEVIDIINKLLKKSCHSLQTLEINAAEFLPGLIFPRMPNVNTIVLFGFKAYDRQRYYFPREICLSDTFPKLTNLLIKPYSDCGRERNINGNDDFFLFSKNKEVLSSVREIKVNWYADDVGLEKYQRWFPNAKIVINKVDEWGCAL